MLITDAKSRDAWVIYLKKRIADNAIKLEADTDQAIQEFEKNSLIASIEADKAKLVKLANFFTS